MVNFGSAAGRLFIKETFDEEAKVKVSLHIFSRFIISNVPAICLCCLKKLILVVLCLFFGSISHAFYNNLVCLITCLHIDSESTCLNLSEKCLYPKNPI